MTTNLSGTLPEAAAAAACGPVLRNTALILDDDPVVADVIARTLRSMGVAATETSDPDAFFAALDRLAPSHLIVDLSMPMMDGLAVLRALAERRTQARIIVTSGHAVRLLESMRQSAMALGLDVVGRLEKPFKASRLRDLVTRPGRGRAPAGPDEASPFNFDPDAFRDALDDGSVRLYLQSRMSCRTGALLGHEALVRWHHAARDVLQPGQFVPQLEASGHEHLLAYRMIDLALADLAARGDRALQMSVNVSLDTFRRPEFRDTLCATVTRHGVDPGQVVLELTESGTGEITASDIETLTRLRMDGHHLAIDDFGVGLSSIQRLIQLPFSEIKIDRMFVRDVVRSDEARKVVVAIIGLGRALGVQVTAEGVEDAATLRVLTELGCDAVQGYFFDSPFPAVFAPRPASAALS